jgi:hypothetical protein
VWKITLKLCMQRSNYKWEDNVKMDLEKIVDITELPEVDPFFFFTFIITPCLHNELIYTKKKLYV